MDPLVMDRCVEQFNFLHRFENLKKRFEDKYGTPPVFFARASGRVNLIGKLSRSGPCEVKICK